MATLGPGVRVWIGWVPDQYCHRSGRPHRLSTGTVFSGPHPPGSIRITPKHFNVEILWRVRSDRGPLLICKERILFPLEDGEDAVPREAAREEPRTCA